MKISNNKNFAISFLRLRYFCFFIIIFLTSVKGILWYFLLPPVLTRVAPLVVILEIYNIYIYLLQISLNQHFCHITENKNLTILLTLLFYFCSLCYCFYIVYFDRCYKHLMTQLLLLLCKINVLLYLHTHSPLSHGVFNSLLVIHSSSLCYNIPSSRGKSNSF